MPRPHRLVAAGYPHHIIQRGNNRQAIFFEEADRRYFLSVLGDALKARQCALHAYVLMTNHVHLLITPRTDADLGSYSDSARFSVTSNGLEKRYAR